MQLALDKYYEDFVSIINGSQILMFVVNIQYFINLILISQFSNNSFKSKERNKKSILLQKLEVSRPDYLIKNKH